MDKKYNQGYLYKNGNHYEFIIFPVICSGERSLTTRKGSVNSVKLDNNISRAKRKIYELSVNNNWEFFFTGTLNPCKYNREDFQSFYKDFADSIKKLNKAKLHSERKIRYLFIPELHKDLKSWHIHGLISGLNQSELRHFKDDKYNWLDYEENFGFCSLELVRHPEAVSKYMTKYITKNLAKQNNNLNAHLFFSSNGLNKKVKIKTGTVLSTPPTDPVFISEYSVLYSLPDDDNSLHQFLSCFSE